jgi:hypothetical protein
MEWFAKHIKMNLPLIPGLDNLDFILWFSSGRAVPAIL